MRVARARVPSKVRYFCAVSSRRDSLRIVGRGRHELIVHNANTKSLINVYLRVNLKPRESSPAVSSKSRATWVACCFSPFASKYSKMFSLPSLRYISANKERKNIKTENISFCNCMRNLRKYSSKCEEKNYFRGDASIDHMVKKRERRKNKVESLRSARKTRCSIFLFRGIKRDTKISNIVQIAS